MNWKEFSRPTKLKILLAIVLFLVLPLTPTPVQCAGSSCPDVWLNGLSLSQAVFMAFSLMASGEPPSILTNLLPGLVLVGVLAAIISYLLSCLIVHLYRKLRVKK